MKRVNEQRPKAFIGAIIGLAGSAIGGILSSRAKKKEAAKQAAIQRNRIAHETNINQANSANEAFANLEQNKEALQESFQNKFMRTGGKTSKSSELSPRKGVVPNIAEGGTAIPIKKNTYLLKGRKHETGGIVIGRGKKSIEAEGDEVVQITPKNLKVFSAQPIINGNSPAELVQRGAKPNKVFDAQERFKDINGLNDDGTRKKVMGGKTNGEVKKRELGDSPYDDPHITINRKRLDIRKNVGKAKGLNISPKTLKVMSNIARFTRVLSPAIEVAQNLFPSKEQEYIEELRSYNNNPTKNMNPKMRIGGNRKRFPILTGEYHGTNEGRAIRSLREARGDSRYQYSSSTNNTPNTSTASMYEKLPLAATSRTAIQQTNKKYNTSSPTGEAVKKQSFNSAFAAARKSGAKTFNYNGRTYGTQLATTKKSNVLPEVVVTASRPKSNTAPRQSTATQKQTITNSSVPASIARPKSNILPEVTVTASRIPKMIKDNTYVPGQYPDTRNPKSNTAPRQSTARSIYKGLKSALGVPERRKRLGGLSRKEDYGSSKKPYPSVESKDFAGRTRSYPIPTKADARDALRLAGLHGRSDVRSKVYKKYPELRKKAEYGTNYRIPETTVLGRRLKKMSPIKPSFNIGNPSVDSLPVKATVDRSIMNPAGITSGAKITNPSAGKIEPISSTSATGNSGGGNGGLFSKIGNAFKGNTGELISAGIGAVGSIISGAMNKSSIDNIQAPQVPTPRAVRPARMKTSYNIAPQLSEIRESEKNLRRVIASNTSSSAASISRQQRVANDAVMQRNKLRGTKENIETQLYNQDALNRQEVESRNTAAVNEANRYNAISAAQTANEKIQAKANNRTQMIEGLTSAVRDYQLGVDSKRRDDLTFAAEAAKNPEQLDLFMNLMKKNKGRINELGFRLGGRNKLLCGGRKKVS